MNLQSTPSISADVIDGHGNPSTLHSLTLDTEQETSTNVLTLTTYLKNQLQAEITGGTGGLEGVATRMAIEVDRICRMSDRIQTSGEVENWQKSLAHHRLTKCLHYYRLGSRRGRNELHSHLSAISYRYIAPSHTSLGFEGRCTLLEDFLQTFNIEVLKAFRRENQLPETYQPRTRLELAEYMAFSEHYAKRRISLPGCNNQQLIVLRAQAFAKRQPAETCVDMEMAVESAKGEDAEVHARSAAVQQIREQMVSEAVDPTEAVLRDRVINELVQYLREQGQEDCIDYLALRLEDLPASEIDSILNLTSRQRDYLQQRFKYHVEKFSQFHNWELVHQWIGAGLDQNLGLSPQSWATFLMGLTPQQKQLLELKQQQIAQPDAPEYSDKQIARLLGCTPKRVQRSWGQLLNLAWKHRNQSEKPPVKVD